MIYLHSSALLKLVRREPETDALAGWLEQVAGSFVTSELGRVEVMRVARRVGGPAVAEARALVADLDLVPLDRVVQDLAVEIGGPQLRTLDALHLASVVLLGNAVSALVVYDLRLAEAARAAGLAVVAPS